MDKKNYYNHNFYAERNNKTIGTAVAVFDIISQYVKIGSVVDFGGGIGTFLAVAKDKYDITDEDILLLEGDYLEQDLLAVPPKCYKPTDLEKTCKIDRKFDLAISLEVAEHLSEKRALSFVKDITDASDIVLFSAAAKWQQGEGHVNEQHLKYWIDMFSKFDYDAFDIIRPQIQHNKEIPFWYRQNMLLFVKNGTTHHQKISSRPKWLEPLDMVTYDMIDSRMDICNGYGKTLWFRIGWWLYRKLKAC